MTQKPPQNRPYMRPPVATPFKPKVQEHEAINPEVVLTMTKALYKKIKEIDADIARLQAQRNILVDQLDRALGREL